MYFQYCGNFNAVHFAFRSVSVLTIKTSKQIHFICMHFVWLFMSSQVHSSVFTVVSFGVWDGLCLVAKALCRYLNPGS